MANASLPELLSAVGAYQQGSQDAQDQVKDLYAASSALNNADALLYGQVASDNATITAAKQSAELRTQANRVAAANAFHSNLSDSGEEITKYAKMADAAQQAKDDALAEISRKSSVSLFDNPLEYIMNKFTINTDIAKHNAADSMLESANTRIQQMNLDTQTAIRTQNEISEPLTAAAADAATRNAASAALVEADKSKLAGLANNVQSIQAVLGMKKEDLALGFQANNAVTAQAQLALSQQHLALSQQEFNFRQAEFREKQDDKLEQRQIGQSVVDTINRGRLSLLGPTAEPLDDLSGKMAIAALKGKGELPNELNRFYLAGVQSKSAGGNVIGLTPAIAADNLQALPVAINAVQGPIKNLLAGVAGDIAQGIEAVKANKEGVNPVIKGIDTKSKASYDAAFNRLAQAKLDTYGQLINPGDSNNPLNIGSINTLAEISPVIKALPVYQKVLAPLVDKGIQLTDPNQVIALIGKAESDGIITHKEMLDTTTIFHVGVGLNLASRNFSSFGLAAPASYKVSLETDPAGFFSTTTTVDLTKPDQLNSAVMKRQSALLSSKFREKSELMSSVTDNAAPFFTRK